MADPISVAVIGAGAVAEAHLYSYQRLGERVRCAAVVDIERQRAEAAAGRYGFETALERHEDALARDDIDAVSICTPPGTHVEIAVEALRAGKHVLCEKPVAIDLAGLDAIAEAEGSSGRAFSGVFQLRFGRGAQQVRALIDEGAFGRLHLGIAETLWFRDHDYYDVWWRGTWATEGGGATVSQAVHVIDALVWFLGEPVSVQAEAGRFRARIEQEDSAVAAVRFANGAIGQITSTTAAMGEERSRLEVYGTELSAVATGPSGSCTAEPFRLGSAPPDRAEALQRTMDERMPKGYRMLHRGNIADFLDAIAEGRRPLADIEACRRALQLTTGIYKSAMTGARVELPIRPDDPWYRAVPPEGFALPPLA